MMTRARFIFLPALLAALTVASTLISRADTAGMLAAAERAYVKADYKTAIGLYRDAMRQGAADPAVWYNLGNAYFKNGELALSILWYERAYQREPGDPRVRENLAIASARVRDKVEPMPLLFIVRWWNDLKGGNSTSALFGWSCALTWLFAGAVFVFFGFRSVLIRRISLVFAAGLAVGAIAAASLYMDKREDLDAHRHAIVMQRVVTAKSTPDATGIDSFTIHEGLKVEITGQRGASWLRIRLADGKDGWIDTSSVTRI
jgi:tetratricopeptide (TPR) repeat protein